MLETVENPELVLSGYGGSRIATRSYGRGRYLVVIYRQVSLEDGFVITAFFYEQDRPEEGNTEKTVNSGVSTAVYDAIPLLLNLPAQRFWVDYDREADVLYISFQRPQKATDTQMTDDRILFRYRNKQLVGVTVLDASTRRVPAMNKAKTTAA